MPLTVRVYGDERPGRSKDPTPASRGLGSPEANARENSLTFDAPRILLGRGEGCEVRLPDPSVSARHLTVRQRGTEYVLVDEGSTNGTRVGKTTLSAHAPYTLRSPEVVRVGKLWVELVVGPEPPTRGAPQRAKEVAIGLAIQSLARSGEDGRPRVRVEEGASAGSEAVVTDGQPLVVGRARDADLFIDDNEASRRHVEIRQRGDVLVVRDLGSKAGTSIGERVVGATDTVWRAGELLTVAGTALSYTFEAAEALVELERQPDQKVPSRELFDEPEPEPIEEASSEEERDDDANADTSGAPLDAAMNEADPAQDEEPDEPSPQPAALASRRGRSTVWSVTDFAVVLLAVGVFSLSAVGYWVLLR
ncbi:MAG: FHA domain-containing protein [Polyangiaceae bacterium]|nr:FHA domain-containing protein [Polyangiaceae bacterium]